MLVCKRWWGTQKGPVGTPISQGHTLKLTGEGRPLFLHRMSLLIFHDRCFGIGPILSDSINPDSLQVQSMLSSLPAPFFFSFS